MNDVLMIMHAREIQSCLYSYKQLPIDKVYFTGYDEIGLEPAIAQFIDATEYDHYLIISDDVIAEAESLAKVRKALEKVNAATGYCNITPNSQLVNLTDSKLTIPHSIGSYNFITRSAAEHSQTELFRTYLAGFMFTGMTKEIWQKCPFECYRNSFDVNRITRGTEEEKAILRQYATEYRKDVGWGSDHCTSMKLQEANIPMWAVRSAFCQHLGGNLKLKPTLIGKVRPSVELVEY